MTCDSSDRRTGWDDYGEIAVRNGFIFKFLVFEIGWQVERIIGVWGILGHFFS